jgi:hypothetical protein
LDELRAAARLRANRDPVATILARVEALVTKNES